MSVLYQLPSVPSMRMGILAVTEQIMPDVAEGATRTFEGGSKTIANPLDDMTDFESEIDVERVLELAC